MNDKVLFHKQLLLPEGTEFKGGRGWEVASAEGTSEAPGEGKVFTGETAVEVSSEG